MLETATRLRQYADRRLPHDGVGRERPAHADDHAACDEAGADDREVERELELEHTRREKPGHARSDQRREEPREEPQGHELDYGVLSIDAIRQPLGN